MPIFPLDKGEAGAPPFCCAEAEADASMEDALACSDDLIEDAFASLDVMTDVADEVILLTAELREEATSADSGRTMWTSLVYISMSSLPMLFHTS